MSRRSVSWMVAIAATTTMVSSATAVQANSLADPTRPSARSAPGPVAVVEPVPQGPVLQSTVVSPGRKSAVISGTPVKVGDVYAGARVVDIRSYEVVLDRDGRQTRLRIVPPIIKDAESTR